MLAAVGEIGKREQQSALLIINVVAQRPLHSGQRRIRTEPGAIALAAHDAVRRHRKAVAERLVETANGVVSLAGPHHVVRRPAVVEAIRPHARQSALRQLLHLVPRHPLPFVDDERIDGGIVRTGAGGDVHERHRLVQVVEDLRVKVEERMQHVAAQRERQPEVVAIIVVGNVVAPVDERRNGTIRIGVAPAREIELAIASIDFDDGRDEHDGVVADLADKRRLLDSEAIRQLHQHFRAAGLRRMN